MNAVAAAPARATGPDAEDAAGGPPRWMVVAVVATIVAGIAFRFATRSDLWLDEALSVNIAKLPLSDLHEALRHDGAPPLYYVLLHGWIEIFGSGDVAVHALSGVISVATLPAAWFAGRRLAAARPDRVWIGWAAVVVLASSPYAIRYATEARMYTLGMLLAAWGYLALRRALERPTLLRLAIVAAITGLLCYTLYWSFYLLAVVGIGLIWRAWKARELADRQAARSVIVAMVAGGLTFVPWLSTFVDQLQHTGTPWGDARLPWVGIADAFAAFAGGDKHGEAFVYLPFLIVLPLLALLGHALDRRRIELDLATRPAVRWELVAAIATLLVGLVASWAGGTAFEGRYASVMFPLLALVTAYGVITFADTRVRAGVLAVVVLLGFAGGVRNFDENRTQASQSADVIDAEAEPGDLVVYCPDQIGPDVSRLIDRARARPGDVPRLRAAASGRLGRLHRPRQRGRPGGVRPQGPRPRRRPHDLVRRGARVPQRRGQVRGDRQRALRATHAQPARRAERRRLLRVPEPRRVQGAVTDVTRRALGSRFVRRDLRAAVVPWMVARFLVGGALAVARFMFSEIGRGTRPIQLTQGLFAWDAAFYRDIALHGYDALPKGALRFFPLFPLLGRGLGWILADHTAVALIVIGNASALVFGALLHRLAEQETGDRALAERAAWFAAVFPAAMVLVMGYAEATAMALAVGMFLALRTKRWELAAVAGLFAGVCRPLGVVLVVPAAIEVARGWRTADLVERGRRALAVIGPAIGLFAYLLYAAIARDDFFGPLTVQNRKSLRGGFVDPFTRLADAFGDLFGGSRFGSGLHGIWALIFLALLVVVIRRFPASYSAYTGAVLVLTLTARNLDSFERYGMSTFPLLLALAYATRREGVDRAALVISAATLAGYAVLGFLGLSVP